MDLRASSCRLPTPKGGSQLNQDRSRGQPHHIITYRGNTSTRTADLTTSKLLWNSVLSTEGTRYMCLNIKNFYLTAALVYYEYMKIPLALFPEWIKKQYNLNTHARDGFVFLEIRLAVRGLPQAGILANKLL